MKHSNLRLCIALSNWNTLCAFLGTYPDAKTIGQLYKLEHRRPGGPRPALVGKLLAKYKKACVRELERGAK